MLRILAMLSLVLFGFFSQARSINCEYTRYGDAMNVGIVAATFDDSITRNIKATMGYARWSPQDNIRHPTNVYAYYSSTIHSLLEDQSIATFTLDNAQSSEIVQVKYNAALDRYVGTRDVLEWKKEKNPLDYKSVAICKFN